jgi:hypothetical protein
MAKVPGTVVEKAWCIGSQLRVYIHVTILFGFPVPKTTESRGRWRFLLVYINTKSQNKNNGAKDFNSVDQYDCPCETKKALDRREAQAQEAVDYECICHVYTRTSCPR